MTDRRCLRIASLAIHVLAAGLAIPGCAPDKRAASDHSTPPPGIVLVAVHALRADHLGAYGYGRATSPGLDRLAAEGAVFEAAIAQASFAGPSHAAILTGRLPQEHGVRDDLDELAAEHETLAEAAARQGMQTAAFVTHPALAPQSKLDQGFESYSLVTAPAGASEDRVPPGEVVDQAVEWLGSVGDRPFLLFVQVGAPRTTYDPDPPFKTSFGATGSPLADAVSARGIEPAVMFAFRESGHADGDLERLVELYDGSIAEVDAALAPLWEKLIAMGRFDATVVAVTADHGEMLGEHDLYLQHDMSLYDPVVRVPLLLRHPSSAAAGRRISSQVRSLDLAPTLLDLAGLAGPATSTGRSLAPALRGQGRDLPAFAENRPLQEGREGLERYRMEKPGIDGKWRMVRLHNAKLILVPGAAGISEELYDLAADPGETQNLMGKRPDLEAQLKALLGEHLTSDPALAGPVMEPGADDDETLEQLRALGYVG